MGKSPEMMLHETCALIPSCKLFGNWNGAICGGSVNKQYHLYFCNCTSDALWLVLSELVYIY
jgi:hypothetical protein